MSEVLVHDVQMKNNEGNWKIFVNREKKFVKSIVTGKSEASDHEAWGDAIINEIKKFDKGEVLVLIDCTKFNMSFYSPEHMKSTKRVTDFGISYCKKAATVLQSFVLRKVLDIFSASNNRYFATEQEAMQWLLKD